MQRLTSVDVMRGLAIIFMVLCHFPIFLSPLDESSPWLYFFSNHIVGDFAAPFFLFLSGFSQVLAGDKGSVKDSIMLPKPIRRGLIIFVVGLLFSISMHGLEAIFEWDILPLIGISTIVLYFLRGASVRTIVFIAFAVVAATPVLRGHSGWLSYWGNKLTEVPGIASIRPGVLLDPIDKFTPPSGLVGTLNGFFLVGYFPIFPWIGFPLLGYALGKIILAKKEVARLMPIFLLGLFFSALGLGLPLLGSYLWPSSAAENAIQGYVGPLAFYPLTPAIFSLQLGFALNLFSALRRYFDRGLGISNEWWLNYFRRLSRYSLTVYVFHHAVIFWSLGLFKRISGVDLLEKAMPTEMAFVSGLLLLTALGPILYFWDQKKSTFSLEWCLARLLTTA